MSQSRGRLHAEPPAEWTVADLLGVLARRRRWIFSCVAVCGAVALLYGILATRRYQATAEIEVEKESHGAFGLDSATADRSVTAVSDSFDDNLTLQTETSLLESDAVTVEVIRRTQLESSPDYFAVRSRHFASADRIAGLLLFWRRPLEPLSTALADAPNRRSVALRIFARHRKIAPVAGTRLIAIQYSDPDPRRAAAVVAALIEALSDANFASRSSAAAQSATWLSGQLADLKRQTDALDARMADLDRAAGDYGDDAGHNVVLARLDALNATLTAAESNRILREAVWHAVQSGNPELLSSLIGSSSSGTATQNAFALLQSLRSQESQAKAQMAESSRRYGENWPGVAEQRARMATIQTSIQEEIGRLGERAHSDYAVSLQAETAARKALDEQKAGAARITDHAVELRLARQEAEESRTLYTSLLGRLQQAGVLAGLHSERFSVASPAMIPAPDHPASPDLPVLAIVALGAGVTSGCFLGVVRELTDTALHTSADLEALLDAPIFAALPASDESRPWYRRMLPSARESSALENLHAGDPPIPGSHSPLIESLQCLRASLLISHSSHAPQVIFVAEPACDGGGRRSHRTGAGAAPVAFGLAAVLAQHGGSTLFLDADLRSATVSGIPAQHPGLSEVLADDTVPALPVPVAALPTLTLLHAGAPSPCPSELIASSRMGALLRAWRAEYTFIVIRGPAPCFAESLVLAQHSDAVLVTVWGGQTTRQEILSAWHTLSRQVPDHAVLGLVFEESHA